MGNIGSQSGHHKYKSTNQENLHWPHSFPRAQNKNQQNPLKVLPEKTPKIRLRPTENGEILQTGGTLTGRQIQAKLDARQIKKSGSEPHLHNMVNMHYSEPFPYERERRFKKKYKAPAPPHHDKNQNSDYWATKKDTSPKPRLFKTKIECERKRSVPEYVDKTEYFQVSHQSLQEHIIEEKPKQSFQSSHRLSLPALNTPVWDFQGELREATRKLRKIGDDETDHFTTNHTKNEISKRNKLNTLDHHMDRTDLMKLKEINMENAKVKPKKNKAPIKHRSEASGKESSFEESSPMSLPLETKCKIPKPFYFGMSSSSSTKHNFSENQKSKQNNYADSESSFEIKRNGYDSDDDLLLSKPSVPKKTQELSRFSQLRQWKQSSSAESVSNPEPPKESKYSSEETEEPPRIFSIFPTTRSRSNDRSRSGDSGISGDGSPAVYEDTPDPLIKLKKDMKAPHSLLPGWTPQQDLGDDSSFEEESYSAGDYTEPFEPSSPQRHVFSLSLPRDHSYTSYANSDYNLNETNLEKIRRSVSGMFNMSRKEAESSPENERGNWFLNKSCNSLNSNGIQLNYSVNTEELEESSMRNVKLNSRRLMYLPKMDKPLRPRRYEARTRPISMNDNLDREYFNSDKLNEINPAPVPESLQDSPVMNDRKTSKKKPKRFTFQSTIRQIERRRIAEKLSREAEKKEQQRLRELEVMQKVEKEFQKKRAREKVSIKQQLSRYSHENNISTSLQDLKIDSTPVRDVLQARSEPDGAVSSSPTSSLTQLDNKQEKGNFSQKNKKDVNNKGEYKSCSDTSDDNRSKPIIQTKVLSEYRQQQREYRDYQSNKKQPPDGESPRQTTIHPEVTYKMPKTKGVSRHGSNNYRKNFAYGIKTKSEKTWNQQPVPSKSKYYSQFGPLTRF